MKKLYRNLGKNLRKLWKKKFLEISGIKKNCGEKLLKLLESRGITKKIYRGNFEELSKTFEGNCRNFTEGGRI